MQVSFTGEFGGFLQKRFQDVAETATLEARRVRSFRNATTIQHAIVTIERRNYY